MRKVFIITLILIGFLVLSASSFVAVDGITARTSFCNEQTVKDKTIEKEFNVSYGKKLTIDLETGGSISIEGWGKEVLKTAVEIDADVPEDIIEVNFAEVASGIDITTEYVGDDEDDCDCNVKIKVMVPERFDLDYNTMGGSVTIKKVEGELYGKTMGGSLNLSGLKGKLDMTTMGGSITLKNSSVDGQVETMGGSITLEDVEGDVDVKTMGGSISQKNVKSRSSSGKGVNVTTMGGSIEVDEAKDGAKVSTMGGSIHTNKISKFLEAETMGGSIDVEDIAGWIEASTMGGSIQVNMSGIEGDRHVDLSTMGGSVTLTVPAELSMDVNIELTYTKNADEDYEIISDFNLNIEETSEWKNSEKKIYGTGQINGGKNKIKIRNTNGDVYLKKN